MLHESDYPVRVLAGPMDRQTSRTIGVAQTPIEAGKMVYDYLQEIGFKSYYSRHWMDGDTEVIDYGSHRNFIFYSPIPKTNERTTPTMSKTPICSLEGFQECYSEFSELALFGSLLDCIIRIFDEDGCAMYKAIIGYTEIPGDILLHMADAEGVDSMEELKANIGHNYGGIQFRSLNALIRDADAYFEIVPADQPADCECVMIVQRQKAAADAKLKAEKEAADKVIADKAAADAAAKRIADRRRYQAQIARDADLAEQRKQAEAAIKARRDKKAAEEKALEEKRAEENRVRAQNAADIRARIERGRAHAREMAARKAANEISGHSPDARPTSQRASVPPTGTIANHSSGSTTGSTTGPDTRTVMFPNNITLEGDYNGYKELLGVELANILFGKSNLSGK